MRWIVGAILALVLVGGLWWLEQKRQAELRPQPRVDIPAEPAQPEPRHPLPKPEVHPAPIAEETEDPGARSDSQDLPAEEPESQPPLPDLADSDDAALQALSDLLGEDFTQRWIKPEFIVSRTVAIVNSLDGSSPSLKTRPLKTLDSESQIPDGEDEEVFLWTEENTERYDNLVEAIESVSPARAAALYGRYYPLFQQAWEELGENEPYFNDRLIDIIDHLLATPEIEFPIQVVPYEGRLHFADESLEEESWGRKLLIRMGPTHAAFIRDWLRDFREELDASTDAADEHDGKQEASM